jgi:hypothetical protein
MSSEELSSKFVDGDYVLDHDSSIGIKYSSTADVKMTYSDSVINHIGGSWKISRDSRPYTLHYVNASRERVVPLSGWVTSTGASYLGVIDVKQCLDVSTSLSAPVDTQPVSLVSTPTPTPTPTLTLDVSSSGLNHTHNDLTENTIVRAIPTVTHVSQLKLRTGFEYNVLLTGYSMNYTTSAYLSCNNSAYVMTDITPANSDQYDNFLGHEIQFDIISENQIIITIPSTDVQTTIDIILMNPAGYGKLTPTYNPVSTEWTDHNLQHSTISIID